MRILVVEDEPAIGAAVHAALAAEGYAVDLIADGDEALQWMDAYPYDLMILDVRLPGRDGFQVCREVRASGHHLPVLMLTALGEVEDRVTGLDAGADDYLPKPFARAELLARARALIRRRSGDRAAILRIDDLELDPSTHDVRRDGEPIRLTAKEFALLEFLARGNGQIFTRERLIDALWGADHSVESNIIEVYVRSVRRKVDGGRRDGLIETVRGVGYRIRAGATGG